MLSPPNRLHATSQSGVGLRLGVVLLALQAAYMVENIAIGICESCLLLLAREQPCNHISVMLNDVVVFFVGLYRAEGI